MVVGLGFASAHPSGNKLYGTVHCHVCHVLQVYLGISLEGCLRLGASMLLLSNPVQKAMITWEGVQQQWFIYQLLSNG